MSNDNTGDDSLSAEARKSKRELSTSKRAAQNRAAQVRSLELNLVITVARPLTDISGLFARGRRVTYENWRRRSNSLNRWRPTSAAYRRKITSCENTFSASNRSFWNTAGNHRLLRRNLKLAPRTLMALSMNIAMERIATLHYHHQIQMVPP